MCVGKSQRPNIPKLSVNANVPDSEHATNSHSYTCIDDPFSLLSIPKTPYYVRKVCDGVYVSQVSNVSLLQYYVTMVSSLCSTVHHQPRSHCPPLLKVADIILKEGACPLRQAFELTSPGMAYDTEKARRKLLVMPLASIRMGAFILWFMNNILPLDHKAWDRSCTQDAHKLFLR